jgi:short-subunit dehydrogenase
MNFTDKKILITGGTAGIGKALLNEFAKRGGQRFAIMARDASRFEALRAEFPQAELKCIQADVSKTSDLDNAVKRLEEEWGVIDILVNNAGVVSAGLLEKISDEDIINQININLTGLILLTKKCLPLLKKSEEGAIMSVSSGQGYIAMPFYSVYAVTKAGVRQFSDALRRELYEFPIHIMTIYPTSTDTPMMKTAKVGEMDSPEMVASKSIQGLLDGELNVIFGGKQRLEDIDTNFNDPKKMDEKAEDQFEALRERTETHRAM